MQAISSPESLFLGVVQGLTEFLPVSSSGHLVIFQHFLGLKEPQILFDVVVHFGTLLAVVAVYRKDLWKVIVEFLAAMGEWVRTGNLKATWRTHPYFRLGIFLVLGTVPAALAGILLRAPLEKAFGSLSSAACMLLITGTVLFFTKKKTGEGRDLEALTLRDALLIGTFQALALMPGISRSGMTIAGGLFLGLNRDLAARFSFLLSVPAILGANILEVRDIIGHSETVDPLPLLLGGGTALFTGYFALLFLLRVVHRGKLSHFAYYCWALGVTVLTLSLLHI
jgi:undecaprenyl-diphosphatase